MGVGFLGSAADYGIIADERRSGGEYNVMTSIIIPTRDAAKRLRGLLAALRSQTIPCEIIVIDSSSSDETVEIARAFGSQVMTVERREFDHGATRMLAVERARGEFLVCMTQDAIPLDRYALENLVAAFRDPMVGAAYGRQLPPSDASPFSAHLRSFNYPDVPAVRSMADSGRYGIRTPFLSNAFAAYRKSILMQIGGFRKGLIMGEDTCAGAELLMAGYRIAYVPEAKVYHSHEYTAFQEFGRYFDIGVFHEAERRLLETFGQAEGEGRRYVASELLFLLRLGKYHLLPVSFVRNCLKYAGYRLGRSYRRIPKTVIRRISMHRGWWNTVKRGEKNRA